MNGKESFGIETPKTDRPTYSGRPRGREGDGRAPRGWDLYNILNAELLDPRHNPPAVHVTYRRLFCRLFCWSCRRLRRGRASRGTASWTLSRRRGRRSGWCGSWKASRLDGSKANNYNMCVSQTSIMPRRSRLPNMILFYRQLCGRGSGGSARRPGSRGRNRWTYGRKRRRKASRRHLRGALAGKLSGLSGWLVRWWNRGGRSGLWPCKMRMKRERIRKHQRSLT